MAEKKYNFGEKTKEWSAKSGKEVDVWQSPKYIQAKKKVVEMLESKEYKDVLDESDFWILMNATKTGKMAYTGLIISHNGCLKINDTLEDKLKFKSECVSLDKEGYNDSLVYTYNCSEQGLYEVGEVSKANCKNDYPYAMALKRCFDRVVLKNSKLAYAGVYSDSEADEFANPNEEKKETKTTKKVTKKQDENATRKTDEKTTIMIQDSQKEIIKKLYTGEEIKPYLEHLKKTKISELTLLEASSLIKRKEKVEK